MPTLGLAGDAVETAVEKVHIDAIVEYMEGL